MLSISELYIRPSNTNTMKNDPIQNNNNNNHNGNNNSNNNDNYFNNSISKYYWEIRKNDIFCFHNFESAIADQGMICHPRVRKGVIKLQQIISNHKQCNLTSYYRKKY